MLTSCCFMRLPTAGLVIGGFQAVYSALIVITYASLIAAIEEDPSNHFKWIEQIFYVILIMFLVVTSINLLTSILLIFGIIKNRHKLLLPWLIVGVIYANLGVLRLCGMVFVLLKSSNKIDSLAGLLFHSLGLALYIYCLCAIYSLFKELKSKNNQVRQMSPADSTHFSQI